MRNWRNWWSCEGADDEWGLRGRGCGRHRGRADLRRAAAGPWRRLRADLVGAGMAQGAGGHRARRSAGQTRAAARPGGCGRRGIGASRPDHRGRPGPRPHPAPLGRPAPAVERGGVGPPPGPGRGPGGTYRGTAGPRHAAGPGRGRGGLRDRTAAGHRGLGIRMQLRGLGPLRAYGRAVLSGGAAARPGPVPPVAAARPR